jgi:hypothetical protein
MSDLFDMGSYRETIDALRYTPFKLMQAGALALTLMVLNVAPSSGLFQSRVLDIRDRWKHFHLPEDILRSYGEMHRTFYRLRGGKLSREQEQGQHKMWATTACESFLFELYFNPYSRTSRGVDGEKSALESYAECLQLAARIYAAEVASTRATLSEDSGHALAQSWLVADKLVEEFHKGLLDEWPGSTYEINSKFIGSLLDERNLPVVMPGTSWQLAMEWEEGGGGSSADDEQRLLVKENSSICLWSARWCPFRPQVSGKIVREKNASLWQDQAACLSQAQKHWQACGGATEAGKIKNYGCGASISNFTY